MTQLAAKAGTARELWHLGHTSSGHSLENCGSLGIGCAHGVQGSVSLVHLVLSSWGHFGSQLTVFPPSQWGFSGKSKRARARAGASLQVAPCPPLHLVLEQVQRQPSWGMGNWILTMGRLKKVQQKAYRYKGASGISAIFGHQSTMVPFYRKERLRENSIIYLRSSGSESWGVGFSAPETHCSILGSKHTGVLINALLFSLSNSWSTSIFPCTS